MRTEQEIFDCMAENLRLATPPVGNAVTGNPRVDEALS